MAREYSDSGARFAFVYTREAHPARNYPCHTTFAQKLQHARDMVEKWNIERPMLVDDLEGSVHHAYGRLPNMTYIVGAGGRIVYRADWTDSGTIRTALDQIVGERKSRRAGARLTPYYLEWQPQRQNAVREFMEGLLFAGPTAVDEFIAAIENVRGEAAAKPMRQWWDERQTDD